MLHGSNMAGHGWITSLFQSVLQVTQSKMRVCIMVPPITMPLQTPFMHACMQFFIYKLKKKIDLI